MNEKTQYPIDRKEADKLLPVQISLVKKLFRTDDVAIADYDADTKQVTDLVVDQLHAISLRLREPEKFISYWNECTFRLPHEWQKVSEGKGDWMLYAFHNSDRTALIGWSLVWLHGLRAAIPDAAKGRIRAAIELGASDEKVQRLIDVGQSFTATYPQNEGQNNFMAVDILTLQSRGYDVIHNTSDQRMATPAKLHTIDGKPL
jgi:hypothetical protein